MKRRSLIRSVILFALLFSAALAQSGTVTVINTNDNLAGSLRQAIQDAASGDTIVFNIPTSDPGYNAVTHVFAISVSSNELAISRDLTIDGAGSKITVQRSGAATIRIFDVTAGAVTLKNLTISNGNPGSSQPHGSGGGGIYNSAVIALLNCTVSGNTAGGGGGALYNVAGATSTVTNCTMQGNAAPSNIGRAIRNEGTLTLNCSTVSGNTIGVNYGAVYSGGGATTHVRNTVIADNSPPSTVVDVRGTFISDGFNFIGIYDPFYASGFGNPGSHDQLGTPAAPANPMLGALHDNGGVTQTMAPAFSSPLIDQGDSGGVMTDERGFRRPVDQPGIPNAGDGSDIGAFELGIIQSAPTFTVTTADEHSDGLCEDQDCTFWDAVNAADNNAANNSVITFAPGVVGTITTRLEPGGMNLSRPMTINGPGARLLTISGAGAGRMFVVSGQGVVISGLTLASGNYSGNGGAIYNFGNLTLQDCAISGNSVTGGTSGGGVYNNSGMLLLTNCTLNGNSADLEGGGIASYNGTVTITTCAISGNSATYGGGIHDRGTSGTVTVTNSTLSGNSATNDGGGIYNLGTLSVTSSTIDGNSGPFGGGIYNVGVNSMGTVSVTNCTISRNSASGYGGGIYNIQGQVIAKSSLIALNTAVSSGPDVSGTFASQGYNLIGKTDGSTGFTAPTDLTGTIAAPLDPKLDPNGLQNNAGPTLTIALLSNSPAINTGDPNSPPRDQRGYVRQDAADIGAFEFGATIPVTLANISTRAFVQTGDNVMIGGLIITGSGQKKVIVRAIGPSLVNFGITDPLQDPTLELHDGTGALISSNDNWMDAPNRQAIIDSGLAPSNNLESAILTSLNPGAYTAIVRGVNNGTGIALVEGYDLDRTVGSKLGNISTRAFVQTGDNVMIGGLIITGPDSDRVIVRAIGPSLAQYGITNPLPDPFLELHDANGVLITSNDNWRDTQQAEIEATGLAPSNDFESAIVRTLTPGNYTAIVRGVNNGTGVALVEVYGLN